MNGTVSSGRSRGWRRAPSPHPCPRPSNGSVLSATRARTLPPRCGSSASSSATRRSSCADPVESLTGFAEALQASTFGVWAAQSSLAYPVANVHHLLGLVMLVGGIGVVDLRLAGAFRSLSPTALRSEEHTSELQSLMRISYAVFCLKKKKNTKIIVKSTLPSYQT